MRAFGRTCGVAAFARLAPARSLSTRVFADYTIFKKKAVLTVSPIKATLTRISDDTMKVDRKGTVLLSFVPAGDDGGYLWQNKQYFGLNAVECGELLALAPGQKKELRFLHDPNMGNNELGGQTTKALSVSPFDDDDAYLMTLFIKQGQGDTRTAVHVSAGEMRVIQSLVSYSMPYLMGWDMALNESSFPTAAPSYGGGGPPASQGYSPPPQQQGGPGGEAQTGGQAAEWPF